MKRLATVAVLFAASSLAVPILAEAAECRGTDLLPTIRDNDPAFVSSLEKQAAAMPFGRGKLFRLTRDGVAPSYLFGTVHSTDPRVTNLPSTVIDALSQARSAAFELAKDPKDGNPFADMAPEDVRALLLAPDEQQAAKLLSDDDFKTLELAALDYNLQPQMVFVMRPSILAVIMAVPACAANQDNILDVRLMKMARAQGKPVTGLETIAEQLGSVRDLPLGDQKQLIFSTVQHLSQVENMLESLLVLYGKGEIGELLAWARSPRPIPSIDAPAPPSFYEALLDRRNVRMAERAMPLVQAGGAFVAVGAAHLPGEGGLVRRFERAGYTVTTVD